MNLLSEKVEKILPTVQKPGRYAGNEIHIIKKKKENVEVRFVLAFPDVYEIGMSHLGLGILYHRVNQCKWAVAQRVYAPWVDMERALRAHAIPLFTLESKTPVRFADVLGITLQYELHYPNVLNLLDLSGIPIRAKDRKEEDPIVIGGGPCAFHAEPLAPLFDALVLGDGEEIILEIARIVRQKKQERWSREETLFALARLPGVYIPNFYQDEYDANGIFQRIVPKYPNLPSVISSNIVSRLKPEYYPPSPLVPLIEVTHDRLSLEIMRGCTRGCRFCSAGIFYRPVRIRPISELVQYAREAILRTGYDEISLVSLSTSDYPHLMDLLVSLRHLFRDDPVAISFPSLRPETLTPEMADFATELRRTGLTLAPEAGTQRLRDVINKNNTEEDLLRAVEIAFEKGWRHVKLYFMIGLPTETEADLLGIVDLIHKVVQIGRRFGRKEVHVSISPFSPKPHTPFQWERQNSIEEFEQKIQYLKDRIRWKEVKLSWRDPRVSQIETALARGDRRTFSAIERAWQLGARFDAWTDQFVYDRWVRAFEETGLSMKTACEAQPIGQTLPWNHLSKGISQAFLLREREKAFSATPTPDCREKGCEDCGLLQRICMKQKSGSSEPEKSQPRFSSPVIFRLTKPLVHRVRIAYRKGPEVRFISHLDVLRAFVRAFRKARIHLAFSGGFHAHPRISPGPPLPLGYTSRAEYLDVESLDTIPMAFERLIAPCLPQGLMVFQHRYIPPQIPPLDGSITLIKYRAFWKEGPPYYELEPAIAEFLSKNSCKIQRGQKEVDIRLSVGELYAREDGIYCVLRLGTGPLARVEEILKLLIPKHEEFPLDVQIERIQQFIERMGKRVTPMEVE